MLIHGLRRHGLFGELLVQFLVVTIFPSKDERVCYFCVGKLLVWSRRDSCQVLLVIQSVFRKILPESTPKSLKLRLTPNKIRMGTTAREDCQHTLITIGPGAEVDWILGHSNVSVWQNSLQSSRFKSQDRYYHHSMCPVTLISVSKQFLPQGHIRVLVLSLFSFGLDLLMT